MSAILESWLNRASCHLSAASAARVRTEIREHYESACEAALGDGAAPDEADRLAVASLGDAGTANRQYRKVLVTASEARLLREERALWSRPWLRALLLIPAAGIWFFGADPLLLVGMAGMGLLFAAPFLPIYTPARGRVFRGVRWAWLVTMLVLACWPNVLAQSWLFASCAWPILWIEGTLISLRRKMPVAEGPKQLYL